eukprot:gb/GECH01013169.1/.p1 GENE.gb/GECH01013169.1/~~gb/GECH01013169.1/.p1  ORF type:complete len:383 (+),score=78.34 gb/GECH01013169.1/:1-1149(+)
MKIDHIETPALLVDLDAFEHNLNLLNQTLEKYADQGLSVRPHAKAHKCAQIANMQMKHGAVGVCCQKVSEVEAMVGGGISNVFLSNEVVEPSKLRRIAQMAAGTHPVVQQGGLERAEVSLCVDDVEVVRELSRQCKAEHTSVEVLVEVNVGQERCGVEPGIQVVSLAREILSHEPHLRFGGIQGYHGWNQHVRSGAERRERVLDGVCGGVRESIRALKDADIPVPRVTGGGTGTYLYEAESGIYTELQPGSYIFMDVDYNTNHDVMFQQSLYVLSSVISKTGNASRAVLDAGLKAVSLDSGVPQIRKYENRIVYVCGGDEHGILRNQDGSAGGDISSLQVGDKLRLIPGHCDPTVNLYDRIYAYRGDTVEEEWIIAGRGPGV